MNFTMEDGIKLIVRAYEERTNERLIERWIFGGYDREINFNEFKDRLIMHRTSTNKTDEEILIDVKNIIDTYNEKVVK